MISLVCDILWMANPWQTGWEANDIKAYHTQVYGDFVNILYSKAKTWFYLLQVPCSKCRPYSISVYSTTFSFFFGVFFYLFFLFFISFCLFDCLFGFFFGFTQIFQEESGKLNHLYLSKIKYVQIILKKFEISFSLVDVFLLSFFNLI